MAKNLYTLAINNVLENLLASNMGQENFRMLLFDLLTRYRFPFKTLSYILEQIRERSKNEI